MLGLEYLHSLKPWGGQGGFTTETFRLVMAAMGEPQNRYKTVHVAGTNGKGSVSCMIASGLGTAGFKVGLNTSPHLLELNERIVIDGLPISDSVIDECALELKHASEQLGVLLSFHEALTGIAFLAFRKARVEYAVIEVGLGGRLDASNVINKPEVCVVTSIGLDHQDILGETIHAIASEKAGIIKSGVKVVVGDLPSEAQEVIEQRCILSNVDVYRFGVDFDKDLSVSISLAGEHQIINASVATKVLELLNVSCTDIKIGFKNAYWPSRLETISYRGRELLTDCAHNPPGIQTLCNHLKSLSITEAVIVFGALATKNWPKMVESLMPFSSEWHILEPDSLSAVPSNEIADLVSCNRIKAISYGKDYDKFISNINKLDPNRLILLTGSIYLVGKIRSLLDIPIGPLWKVKR